MSRRKNKLVPFETIVLATQGDPQALEQDYTALQTVHTLTLPPGIHCGKRQRFHRMRQRTETAT